MMCYLHRAWMILGIAAAAITMTPHHQLAVDAKEAATTSDASDGATDTTDTTANDASETSNAPDAPDDNDDAPPDDESIKFRHFIAHPTTQTCTADDHATPFNNLIRGVNLGGWMVLEPWITPSLFYQFLGGDETNTAMDHYTFCEVLGPEEGNRQLRRHWETWVTEEIVQELADSGAVNSFRLPVGDFMYNPYGPYVGCTDGALEYVERLLDWAHSYGISVLIDVHTQKDSQNGFDNSGQSLRVEWYNEIYPRDFVTFQHWPIQGANWLGTWDPVFKNYTSINYDNIKHSLTVIEKIVDLYVGHPAVLGVEPVNEPWWNSPLDVLKTFYWDAYLIVKEKAPYWKFVMHSSFKFGVKEWSGFMKGCPDIALDEHIYQMSNDPAPRINFYGEACSYKGRIAQMERAFGPVIVGEWSLATDSCTMWLYGFNDNKPGYPRSPCKLVPCPPPYMGEGQPDTPVDPTKPIQGPYGTGMSGPTFGLCPVSRDWLTERYNSNEQGNEWMTAPPEAPPGRDGTDEVMGQLALKKISAFSGIGHGYYFWNFRTELPTPQWSYLLALEKGWIPKGDLNDERIMNSCHREDAGEFTCEARRDASEEGIRGAMQYVIQTEGKDSTYIYSLHNDDLYDEADTVLGDFWKANRGKGVTCDFGGVAMLLETNATHTEDYYTDDYFNYVEVNVFPVRKMVALGVLGILLGSVIGFTVAMKLSPRFNRAVRSSQMLRPISSSQLFRKSFGGPLDAYSSLH